MITALPERVAGLPPHLRDVWARMFDVHGTTGRTIPPPAMAAWIERQFGNLRDVQEQTIVRVINRLTLEETLFNPLRARRPASSVAHGETLETWIAEELAGRDMFRHPEEATTADVFGRIRGKFCVTAANVAKYEGWHDLVIFDEPHPLRWNRAQLRDYFDTAWRWLLAAHAHDATAVYPIIAWNCLPKSGATLMHGHMQIALAHGQAYAHVEQWRRAAAHYRAAWRRTYFDDLFALQAALELAVLDTADVRAFASLTPQRSREMVLLGAAGAPRGHERMAAQIQSLADGLYDLLRGLMDGQGMRAFNVGVALPPLGRVAEDWSDVPIFARVMDRGAALSCHSDIGAIELMATGCVVTDPFDVAARLRMSLR
ncbi:MAG TPA: hypothetical protein VFT66_23175 [Roseiflexaceae bacterium]|nr:hypothetical protein [Roseiflexaceae bacterium]